MGNKIISIVGARPQFIKAAVISNKLRENNKEILVHTGQHYDDNLSKIFFDELNISKPDYNLGVGSGSHGYQTGQILIKIEKILLKENPNLVIVYGDTNSTLAGALASAKLNIPVAHVEAGLRSFDKSMPEEINRLLTDHISKILFAPNEYSVNNLNHEGIDKGIYNVGDVMIESIYGHLEIAEQKSNIVKELNLQRNKYCLLTIHRQDNTDNFENLKTIIDSILKTDSFIVFPVHPRTKKALNKIGYYSKLLNSDNIKLIDPIGYLDFLKLEKNSEKIITDSGGIQKEAYFLGKPCITLRNNTEWIETVNDGKNILVGTNPKKIIEAINCFNPRFEKDRITMINDLPSNNICKVINEFISN
ncbi:MAG TPA: UDP-N-acetylglucosamine 2-epimerase (non-hydrolyzing) [Methanofastidiosum sp.]|nr:UDP-N-acetylglucosamine 2-epimerase (non-hydrolyzing) [Methanofastidiosum sp.]